MTRATMRRRDPAPPPLVALVAAWSTPQRPHGVGDYTARLAAQLAGGGQPIEVWAQRGAGLPADLATPAPSGAGIPLEAGAARVIPVWRPGLLLGWDLLRRLRRTPPRVLHVQFEHGAYGGGMGVASLLAALVIARTVLGRPTVATVHQVPSSADLAPITLRRLGVRRPAWARLMLRAAMRALALGADRLIVHAEVFRRRLVEEWGHDPRRVRVVPHGTPEPGDGAPDAEGRVASAAGSAPDPEPRRLLLFGYVKWYKGPDVAIEAFRRLAPEFPGWTLTIAGPVPAAGQDAYGDAVRSLAAPLGSAVEFTGCVPEAAVEPLLRGAAVALFPYRVLFAASGPLALALGLRLPVVISDALGPLCPGWPFRCRPDPDDLARVLRPLMRDPARRAYARTLAARRAADAAWPRAAALTDAVYRELLPADLPLRDPLTA